VFPSARAASAAAIGTNECQQLVDGGGRKPEMIHRSAADEERIALHESCHAMTGRLLGSPLGGMTCDPGDGFSGLCWGPSYVSRFTKDEPDSASLVKKIGPMMCRVTARAVSMSRMSFCIAMSGSSSWSLVASARRCS
jgi:hypothetical protein